MRSAKLPETSFKSARDQRQTNADRFMISMKLP